MTEVPTEESVYQVLGQDSEYSMTTVQLWCQKCRRYGWTTTVAINIISRHLTTGKARFRIHCTHIYKSSITVIGAMGIKDPRGLISECLN